jgi:hypothetical protein
LNILERNAMPIEGLLGRWPKERSR